MSVGKLLTILPVLIVFIIFTGSLRAAGNNLILSEYTPNSLSIQWSENNYELESYDHDDNQYTNIRFTACSYPQTPAKPAIPFKEFLIAVPEGAQLSWNVSAVISREVTDIIPLPVMFPERTKKDVPEYDLHFDQQDYDFLPENLISFSEQVYFRDIPVVRVRFYPVSYNYSARRLNLITNVRINIVFNGGRTGGFGSIGKAMIDKLYPELILNYEQGKAWSRTKISALAKPAIDIQNPWYKITVDSDGLYKITPATLASAGTDVSAIDPRTIKIYNAGGRPLNTQALAETNNPHGPVENAVMVIGEDDGVLNDGDYILFYGSRAGGWHPSGSTGDFVYFQHPYDTKNQYWLTFGGVPGKRMSVTEVSDGNPVHTESHFIERRRFEQDQYNLLASGNDWYGHRFYGTSGSASFNYSLDYSGSDLAPGRMNIKFKSGNAIRYGDSGDYSYTFTVSLNQQPVLINRTMGSRGSRTWNTSFVASNNFNNGTNTVSVNYTGETQDCEAYLDWVEFYYPMSLTANNNILRFYTNTLGTVTEYSINGFSAQNVYLFNITDPINVHSLAVDDRISDGILDFKLDLSDNRHKKLIAASLSSSEIKSIGTLTPFIPDQNLLDPGLAADMIIITHPSFEPYAREIADLRNSGSDPVSSVIVNTRDIYFFFSSGVQDVTAIRNFIRHAFNTWTSPRVSYIMLFGDGHYDYRHISIADTNWVPPFEISDDYEVNSRETDNYYVDVNFNSSSLLSILPDLAIGRLPVESHRDARIMVDKLESYENARERDGWQTAITFVADDQVTNTSTTEWMHQRDTERLALLPGLQKFLIKRIYLTAFSSVPGGFGRVKPAANQAIIDQVNEGTLLINYVGHGSPEEWAHENVLNMTRDLKRIQNQGRLPIWVAATCDFGKYDDPREPSFSEALLWEENTGGIAVFSSARLVYSSSNFELNSRFLSYLFPVGQASRRLGETTLLATQSGANDQKYHLFGDPSMYLADPREYIEITSVSPDTLKALSLVNVEGFVSSELSGPIAEDFSGGAMLIANDAEYDSVNTGGSLYYRQLGPRIFKGEISVDNGRFNGQFIVPKSIRYNDKASGRVTLFAWDEAKGNEALGYFDRLLFNGTKENLSDAAGPAIDIYFKNQEDFNSGDLVPRNVTLVAEIADENGINLTQEVGHSIDIQIDDEQPRNITSFFAYERDSYSEGKLNYYLEDLPPGEHVLTLQAWDNLNNPTRENINFRISESSGLVLSDVVNYPNPFAGETNFTFQAQPASDASLVEVEIKIYTVSGRHIRTLDGLYLQQPGFNYYAWDGRDADGDVLANGVYLYKIILREGDQSKEVIEKLVVLR